MDRITGVELASDFIFEGRLIFRRGDTVTAQSMRERLAEVGCLAAEKRKTLACVCTHCRLPLSFHREGRRGGIGESVQAPYFQRLGPLPHRDPCLYALSAAEQRHYLDGRGGLARPPAPTLLVPPRAQQRRGPEHGELLASIPLPLPAEDRGETGRQQTRHLADVWQSYWSALEGVPQGSVAAYREALSPLKLHFHDQPAPLSYEQVFYHLLAQHQPSDRRIWYGPVGLIEQDSDGFLLILQERRGRSAAVLLSHEVLDASGQRAQIERLFGPRLRDWPCVFVCARPDVTLSTLSHTTVQVEYPDWLHFGESYFHRATAGTPDVRRKPRRMTEALGAYLQRQRPLTPSPPPPAATPDDWLARLEHLFQASS
ncbi:hypothetical protein Dxin01_00836 [Deinococcus xinjiangensis]|uniref:Uncharacterized protein n=1 Tax=Deinococcus xinjiangensis TaxID=457454 RepID=A0ABP9V743_9DEIO